MQPYFFPYIGYFQLIRAVDKFIFYDDVAFIKQGWINRNRLLVAGAPYLFSVPLTTPSSFQSIRETKVSREQYGRWEKKFMATLSHCYREAPYREPVTTLVGEVCHERPET